MPMSSGANRTRRIAGAIAVVVVVDALWVQAPFLVVLALPFAMVAWRYRGEHAASGAAVMLLCTAYAAIGVSYALTNGLHGPVETGQLREVISVGDFVFVYFGTPLAVWLGVRVGTSMVRRPVVTVTAQGGRA
ncbi:MAG: hypothetical protein WD691_07020 [Acidimicrobiales bacterium]